MAFKQEFNQLKLSALFLLLAGCTQATNLAASFVPTHHQNYDAAELKSGTYVLDIRHSSLHMSFDHMGFSTTVGRFDTFEATLEFDKENPGDTRLSVRIDPASVNTNYGELDDLLVGKSTRFLICKPWAGLPSLWRLALWVGRRRLRVSRPRRFRRRNGVSW